MKRTATAPTAAQLTACKSREDAHALLPAALLRPQLNAVAAELGIEAPGRFRTKAALVEAIVQRAVGARLNHEAILNSCQARPSEQFGRMTAPAPDRGTVTTALAAAQDAATLQMQAWTRRIARAVTEGTLSPDALRRMADAAQALADAARAAAAR